MMREYLNEPIIAIIAPAGYGKTEEIADAVKCCKGKQLILTHTRAGVAALQNRMKRKQIDDNQFAIDTIAAFCLKWCKAYPHTAEVTIPDNISDINYSELYRGTKRIFLQNWAKDIIQQSYSGLFIDEYQDCTESQHSIFMELVNVLPIRIFGDPLQGIFYWVKDDPIVDWNNFQFKVIRPLTKAWRWENSNKELGLYLRDVRNKLIESLHGKDVSIAVKNKGGCVSVLNTNQWNNGKYVYSIKKYENIVYLTTISKVQKEFSLHNGGYFQCDEVKDLSDVEKVIEKIESQHNEAKALELITALQDMINAIRQELKSYINHLSKKDTDFSRIKKYDKLGMLIKNVCKENSVLSVLQVLNWFAKSENDKFKIYRKEMFYRIKKIYAYMAEKNISLHEAVNILNNQQYFDIQPFNFSRLSSRTVLTKGLEFDCVIIDARYNMDVRDFYVAMTRAKRYIYIITDEDVLHFDGIYSEEEIPLDLI